MIYIDWTDDPRRTLAGTGQRETFVKVEAFECEFCHRLFAKKHHHRLCKSNPTLLHCGYCKCYSKTGYTTKYLEWGEEEIRNHFCTKNHDNRIPRKYSCKDYVEVNPFSCSPLDETGEGK